MNWPTHHPPPTHPESNSDSRYCTKEEDFISNLDQKSLSKVNCWQEAREYARSGNLSSALNALERTPQGAMQLTLSGKRIRKELKRLLPQVPVAPSPLVRPLADFQHPRWDKTLALLIWGPSEMGKTSLALSLMPTALIVNHKENLSHFNQKTNGGIIFDDMAPIQTREEQLSFLDRTKTVSITGCRYKNPQIPMGTPTIFCTNWEPKNYFSPVKEVFRRLRVWKAVALYTFVEENYSL